MPTNQHSVSLSIGGLGFFVSRQIKKQEKNFLQLYGNYQFSDAFVGIQKKHLPYLKAFNTKDVEFNFHHQIAKNIEINTFSYGIDEDFKVNVNSLNYSGKANADKKRFCNVSDINYYTPKGAVILNLIHRKSTLILAI